MKAEPFTVRILSHGGLEFFVRPKSAGQPIVRRLCEKTSVKDAIEACGVPHPEVDLILVDEKPVGFQHCLIGDAVVEVYPVLGPGTLFPEHRLQRRAVRRFVADGHLGKLVRHLRLLGIDTAYDHQADDRQLLKVAIEEDRALLTRDRRLLMHAVVRDGYYPRSQIAEEQTREVVRRFDLASMIAPWSRCLRCNGSLAMVSKPEVFGELEPLTRIYYDKFRRCARCGQVYWSGSHFQKLEGRIERLLAIDSAGA